MGYSTELSTACWLHGAGAGERDRSGAQTEASSLHRWGLQPLEGMESKATEELLKRVGAGIQAITSLSKMQKKRRRREVREAGGKLEWWHQSQGIRSLKEGGLQCQLP